MLLLFGIFMVSSLVYSLGLDPKDVVIVILSQENEYHLSLAKNLKINLQEQAGKLSMNHPVVHLSHKEFPHVGDWTILPLIPKLSNLHEGNSSWIFFVEDRTNIRLLNLLELLKQYDYKKEIWIGYALHDNEATIIHHFAFNDNPKSFKYPNTASGFAISSTLLKRLAARLMHDYRSSADFSIDNAHELALFIWDKGKGPVLQHEPKLCTGEEPHCATFPIPFQQCSEAVPQEALYFAVKTCKKFHKDRVAVVKNTWGRYASRIKFFSDEQDTSIPTEFIGIPNTEQGHCFKTIEIIRRVVKEIKNTPEVKWVIIADDDTILSVSRMRQLLTCYDPDTSVALGERYGYGVLSSRGYNYITGGGGMIFSRVLMQKLAQKGVCDCPSINTPDDMYLGTCIASLGISVTHSPLFHQARPVDYSQELLKTNEVVSFHKHWMIDPIKVYNEWFAKSDSNSYIVHKEL